MTPATRTRGLPVAQGLPAGVVSRTVAAVVDALVLLAILLCLQFGWAAARLLVTGPPFSSPDPDPVLSSVLGCVLLVVYLAGSWSLGGRTVGDQMMGLRVTGRSGRRLSPGTAVVRAVLCALVPLGLLWIPLSRRGASLQDLVLGSTVVHDWYGRTGSRLGGNPRRRAGHGAGGLPGGPRTGP